MHTETQERLNRKLVTDDTCKTIYVIEIQDGDYDDYYEEPWAAMAAMCQYLDEWEHGQYTLMVDIIEAMEKETGAPLAYPMEAHQRYVGACHHRGLDPVVTIQIRQVLRAV